MRKTAYGVKNSPMMMQRIMDKIFVDVKVKFMMIYFMILAYFIEKKQKKECKRDYNEISLKFLK